MMDTEEGTPQSWFSFAGLASSPTDVDAARFIVVPVPYESTTEWLPGTRRAPGLIIDSSRLLELYDQEVDLDISTAGIATTIELPPVFSSPENMVAAVRREVASWLARSKTPVLLGGEHTITIGAVQAMRERFPGMSVLQLDAHADLRDSYLGARYSQATTMRRIHELCPVVEAGVRSLSLAERRYVDEYAVPVVFWPPEPDSDWVATVLEKLGNDVYLTIDADVFDSALLPWVGTPEPGGPDWSDIWALLRRVATMRHVVGFDVVEFAPYAEGAASSAYMLARLIYRLIGYVHRRNLAQEALHND